MNVNAAMATIESVVQDFVREQGTIEHLKRGRVDDTIYCRPCKSTEAALRDRRCHLNGQVIHLDTTVHERGEDRTQSS